MPSFEPLAPPQTIGDLFERPPMQYGLRGDTYLWQELRSTFAETPLPENYWALRKTLESGWADAVGQRLDDRTEAHYVERFDPGSGLSAGRVLPSWWHATGLPLILDRYCAFSGEH
jgi:hypothetical protein